MLGVTSDLAIARYKDLRKVEQAIEKEQRK
jgi:hypothetical protein